MYMKCVNRRDFEADLEMTDLRFGFWCFLCFHVVEGFWEWF
jgi:hypothetical protein